MDTAKEREIIKLWNRLRLLEKEGRPVAIILRQIEKALAERGDSSVAAGWDNPRACPSAVSRASSESTPPTS